MKRRSAESAGDDVSVSSHRLVFWITTGMLSVAVVLAWLQNLVPAATISRLPVLCAFRRTVGVPCPGCGLTRSWVALAGGHLKQSLDFHRMGWIVMLYVFFQALRHGLWVFAPALRKRIDRWGSFLDQGIVLLAVGLFVNWIFVLLGV